MFEVLMPILTMVTGLIAHFADPKRSNAISVIFIIVLLASCLLGIHANRRTIDEKDHTIEEKDRKFLSFSTNPELLRNALIEVLRDFGWFEDSLEQLFPTPPTRFTESLEADKARRKLASTTEGRSETEIKVQYFPKDVDGAIVNKALQELNFRLTTAEPQVTDVETNAIWFGKNVSVKDLKLLAYTLIRANVGIKVIRPFRQPDKWPGNLIQVGADAAYANRRPLTVDEIRQAERFVRTPD